MAKILIVDDDKDLSEILQTRLSVRGHDVDVCVDGGRALESIIVGGGRYDLILLDYFLPSLKGDQICRHIRENEKLKKLPILILTSFSNYSVDFFKSSGATDVLYKPVDKDTLFNKIESMLIDSGS